jgi:hypothetical protein
VVNTLFRKVLRRYADALLPYLAALLVLTLATPTALVAAPPGPPRPVAGTPEEVVALLAKAGRAGDVNGFIAQLGAHSRATHEMVRAFDAFEDALDAKFGKDPVEGRGETLKARIVGTYKRAECRVRRREERPDGSVLLTVWLDHRAAKGCIEEETWVAVLEGGGWRLVLPGLGEILTEKRQDERGREVEVEVLKASIRTTEESAEWAADHRATARALEQTSKEVRDGRYRSREKAGEGFRKALERLQGGKNEP